MSGLKQEACHAVSESQEFGSSLLAGSSWDSHEATFTLLEVGWGGGLQSSEGPTSSPLAQLVAGSFSSSMCGPPLGLLSVGIHSERKMLRLKIGSSQLCPLQTSAACQGGLFFRLQHGVLNYFLKSL